MTKRRKIGQRTVNIYEFNEKIVFSDALFYILPSREKSGWILYQITDLVIIRVKTMILFWASGQ